MPRALLTNAKALRQSQTDAETLIWRLLRNNGLGVKFRRQHAIGGHILDFYCHEKKLAVELDGGQHASATEQDERRTAALDSSGIIVIRFWNHDVLQNTESVLTAIWNEIYAGADSPHPSPLPEGEGVKE